MSNTIDMSAEMIRQLGMIVDDEALMRKALKAVKRIVASRDNASYSMPTAYNSVSAEPTIEEQRKEFVHALNEVKQYKLGQITLKDAEDLINEL